MTETERFFDTNVLLYLISGDGDKAQISENLLVGGGVVSVQVLNEFVSVARRRFGVSWDKVDEMTTTFKNSLTVAPLTLEVHDRGVALAQRHNFAIYDAMIVAAAQLPGCRKLYTEDMHAGQALGGLRIVNPYV